MNTDPEKTATTRSRSAASGTSSSGPACVPPGSTSKKTDAPHPPSRAPRSRRPDGGAAVNRIRGGGHRPDPCRAGTSTRATRSLAKVTRVEGSRPAFRSRARSCRARPRAARACGPPSASSIAGRWAAAPSIDRPALGQQQQHHRGAGPRDRRGHAGVPAHQERRARLNVINISDASYYEQVYQGHTVPGGRKPDVPVQRELRLSDACSFTSRRVLTGSPGSRSCRELMERAKWVDGRVDRRAPVGQGQAQSPDRRGHARGARDGRDDRRSPWSATASSCRRRSRSAIFPPLFNRYEQGMNFGAHVDNAIRQVPGTPLAFARISR